MADWELYERWVAANAAAIATTLGLEPREMRFRTQAHVRGAELRHRVDVLGEADGRLVIVEVKDRHPLPRKEAMEAVYRVIDIAHAYPDTEVVGILVSSASPSRAVRRIVHNAKGVFQTPDNVQPPQHLVMTPPETIGGHILLRRYEGTNVTVSVIHLGPVHDLGQLERAVLEDPTFEGRLTAALEVLARYRDSRFASQAAWEAGVCLLHIGSGHIVLDMQEQLTAEATRSPGNDAMDHTQLLLDMAFFQTALHRSAPPLKPARNTVQRLARSLSSMGRDTQVEAKQFLGAWIGLYDDPALARKQLNDSLALAEGTAGEAYFRFMGHMRLAELSRAAEREEHLAAAAQLLDTLGPIAGYVAQEMYTRARAGRDASIASHFGSDGSRTDISPNEDR